MMEQCVQRPGGGEALGGLEDKKAGWPSTDSKSEKRLERQPDNVRP